VFRLQILILQEVHLRPCLAAAFFVRFYPPQIDLLKRGVPLALGPLTEKPWEMVTLTQGIEIFGMLPGKASFRAAPVSGASARTTLFRFLLDRSFGRPFRLDLRRSFDESFVVSAEPASPAVINGHDSPLQKSLSSVC